MTIKNMVRIVLAVALLVAYGSASAVSIAMAPTDVTIASGETTVINIFGDFSDDPTVGGGFDILFDPSRIQILDVLQAPVGDPTFMSFGGVDNVAGVVSSIAFGDFGGVGGAGFLIATITVQYLGGGATTLSMTDNADGAGPFFSASTFAQQTVDYSGTTIQSIPLPAAVLLMLSGLGTLLGFRRRL